MFVLGLDSGYTVKYIWLYIHCLVLIRIQYNTVLIYHEGSRAVTLQTKPLYSVQYTLYSVQYTLYTVHSTLYTVHYTLYNLHSRLYTVHCTLYTVHCTLYTHIVQCSFHAQIGVQWQCVCLTVYSTTHWFIAPIAMLCMIYYLTHSPKYMCGPHAWALFLFWTS